MIAVLVSGGKDSTASFLLALEMFPKDRVVPIFTDTGWESSKTYEYLNYLEEATGVNIIRLRSNYDLISLIRVKKRFPNARMRFCTAILKQVPVIKYLGQRKDIRELWIGIRASESSSRQKRYGNITFDDTWKYSEWLSARNLGGGICKKDIENVSHILCRFPIADWSEERVFTYLQERGILPNPLYDMGHKRVGCYPCILGSEADFWLCWQTEEGKRNLYKLRDVEEELQRKGYNTRLKDHITAKELIRRFEHREKQGNLFTAHCVKEETCELCKI